MDYSEFLPGSVYISSFNDKEYTFVGVKMGLVWLSAAGEPDRPVSIETFKLKYNLKQEVPKKKKRNVAV